MRLAVLASILVACAPPPAAEAPPPAPASAAARPVATASASTSAPASEYDAAFAKMQSDARAATHCFVAEYGTCGEYRYLDEIPGGLVGTTRYFDASGKLASTHHYNVEHPGSSWDGPAIACAKKKTADLCAR